MRGYHKKRERVEVASGMLPLVINMDDHTVYVPAANDQYFLYLLIDPETQEICYVGQTYISPNRRLQQHCQEWHKHGLWAKGEWILGLRRRKLWPTMFVFFVCGKSDVDQLERQLIHDLWDAGCPLVNRAHRRLLKNVDHWREFRTRIDSSEWAQKRSD